MSFILCIETATEICSVAVSTPNNILALCQSQEKNTHSSQLTILIEKAITLAKITLKQLDAIAISKGPGSYTGLRVGVSMGKGLCYALDKPLIGVPTLQSLVHNLLFVDDKTGAVNQQLKGKPFPPNAIFIPMLDARRMEVYCAGYDLNGNEIKTTEAKIIDHTAFAEELNNGPVYFMGNGSIKCKEVITHPNAFFIDDIDCSASGMAMLAAKAYENNKTEDVAYFEPFYLKDFVGTTAKKKVE